METKEIIIFSVIAIFAVLLSSFAYFNPDNNYITGNAVSNGGVDDQGDKESANPDKGVLKGTVTYTIKDGSTTINSEYAENASLYFSKKDNTISNFAKVKQSSKEYKSNVVTIDVDGSNSRCSSNSYTTILSYYDDNANGQEDGSEFTVYKTIADANGCYAAKLKGGDYNIYL